MTATAYVDCPYCGGHGQIGLPIPKYGHDDPYSFVKPCEECEGTGTVDAGDRDYADAVHEIASFADALADAIIRDRDAVAMPVSRAA